MFAHTRSGRGRICHFLRTMMVWSARFRSGCGKLGVGPISCGAVFAPAPPPLRDRACVNACNDLCWSQFSARPRTRPPAHVWTYLYWPFVRGIHWSPVNSPHKGQWRGALMFSLAWINDWVNQWWGWWCETPLHPSWRQCNVYHWSHLIYIHPYTEAEMSFWRNFYQCLHSL